MLTKEEIFERDEVIEALTHDGYFVQIPYIIGNPRTQLEHLLSLFEQKYFIDDKNITKEYDYPIDDENLKMMLDILKHAAADEITKREMEEDWLSEYDEKEWSKELAENKRIIAENKKEIAEKDNALAENKKEIEENKKSLAEKDKKIAELDKLKTLEFAKKLKKDNMPIELIVKYTNLSKKEIEKL